MASQPIPTIDPNLVALITGAITAIAGYAVARVGKGTKQVEKAPEVQEQINKAVSGLIAHYTQALEHEKARHADHVQDLEERIERQDARIAQLVAAMRSAGIVVPDEE